MTPFASPISEGGPGCGAAPREKADGFTSLTTTVQIHLPRVTCRDGIQSYYEARIIPHMSRSPPNSMITGTAPPAPQVRLRTALPGLAGVVRWYPAVRYGPDSSPRVISRWPATLARCILAVHVGSSWPHDGVSG